MARRLLILCVLLLLPSVAWAQETFSWSSKATTGFTLTSSNSGSTATCDVVIVR